MVLLVLLFAALERLDFSSPLMLMSAWKDKQLTLKWGVRCVTVQGMGLSWGRGQVSWCLHFIIMLSCCLFSLVSHCAKWAWYVVAAAVVLYDNEQAAREAWQWSFFTPVFHHSALIASAPQNQLFNAIFVSCLQGSINHGAAWYSHKPHSSAFQHFLLILGSNEPQATLITQYANS